MLGTLQNNKYISHPLEKERKEIFKFCCHKGPSLQPTGRPQEISLDDRDLAKHGASVSILVV